MDCPHLLKCLGGAQPPPSINMFFAWYVAAEPFHNHTIILLWYSVNLVGCSITILHTKKYRLCFLYSLQFDPFHSMNLFQLTSKLIALKYCVISANQILNLYPMVKYLHLQLACLIVHILTTVPILYGKLYFIEQLIKQDATASSISFWCKCIFYIHIPCAILAVAFVNVILKQNIMREHNCSKRLYKCWKHVHA